MSPSIVAEDGKLNNNSRPPSHPNMHKANANQPGLPPRQDRQEQFKEKQVKRHDSYNPKARPLEISSRNSNYNVQPKISTDRTANFNPYFNNNQN